MPRNTSVLSMKPWKRSAPGPIARSTASSAVCTACSAPRGRLPTRNCDCGCFAFSLAAYGPVGPAPTAGVLGPSR